ncbi:hypothetical protein CVU37_13570 [candidate division BRC1 bacterium HGW-BRC1-1]|jgi:hypothetical protein|nr:MAG: hypothetical protein CVU37_13570 [candidate division BRC1 bacterium HGW-BRC1-1]
MILPDNFRPSRKPDELLREVDAAIKVRDIGRLQKWRDTIEIQWWESFLVVMLFIAGLGFIITIYKLLPVENRVLFYFVFFWFFLFTLALVASVEMLIAKISALRGLTQWQEERILRLEARHASEGRTRQASQEEDSDRNSIDNP